MLNIERGSRLITLIVVMAGLIFSPNAFADDVLYWSWHPCCLRGVRRLGGHSSDDVQEKGVTIACTENFAGIETLGTYSLRRWAGRSGAEWYRSCESDNWNRRIIGCTGAADPVA